MDAVGVVLALLAFWWDVKRQMDALDARLDDIEGYLGMSPRRKNRRSPVPSPPPPLPPLDKPGDEG